MYKNREIVGANCIRPFFEEFTIKGEEIMKILKRNQLIVLVISLMLITAGYLNFTSNQENVQTSTIADRDDTTIGDAQLVSTIPDENEEEKIQNLITGQTSVSETENTVAENEIQANSVVNEESTEETKEVSSESEDYYFTTSKLDRSTMYSEMLETYQEMYNNANSTAEQKTEALTKINEINNTKNAIMIAENLVLAKGFEDIVIFVNEESISVVIEAEDLKQEDVAQIQNIVSRELNAGAEKIHISNK